MDPFTSSHEVKFRIRKFCNYRISEFYKNTPRLDEGFFINLDLPCVYMINDKDALRDYPQAFVRLFRHNMFDHVRLTLDDEYWTWPDQKDTHDRIVF